MFYGSQEYPGVDGVWRAEIRGKNLLIFKLTIQSGTHHRN